MVAEREKVSVLVHFENHQHFHSHLVSASTFRRVSARISKEKGVEIEDAEKIFDGTLGFLLLCAKHHAPIIPSPSVDVGWHEFLMYTIEYAEFCERVAGRFLHHIPNDEEVDETPRGGGHRVTLSDTVAAFLRYRIQFHADQWVIENKDGQGCRCGCSGKCKPKCKPGPPCTAPWK